MYSGLFEADKLGIANKVELLSKEVCVENWYIGISKKSPYAKYLPQINKKLDELINNGTVDRLIEKYGSQYRKSIAKKKGALRRPSSRVVGVGTHNPGMRRAAGPSLHSPGQRGASPGQPSSRDLRSEAVSRVSDRLNCRTTP
jgi:hypothetical protein